MNRYQVLGCWNSARGEERWRERRVTRIVRIAKDRKPDVGFWSLDAAKAMELGRFSRKQELNGGQDVDESRTRNVTEDSKAGLANGEQETEKERPEMKDEKLREPEDKRREIEL